MADRPQYRPASRARVLAFLAGLASRGERTVEFHSCMAELTTLIAFGSAAQMASRSSA